MTSETLVQDYTDYSIINVHPIFKSCVRHCLLVLSVARNRRNRKTKQHNQSSCPFSARDFTKPTHKITLSSSLLKEQRVRETDRIAKEIERRGFVGYFSCCPLPSPPTPRASPPGASPSHRFPPPPPPPGAGSMARHLRFINALLWPFSEKPTLSSLLFECLMFACLDGKWKERNRARVSI
jgi:hypothetical protein